MGELGPVAKTSTHCGTTVKKRAPCEELGAFPDRAPRQRGVHTSCNRYRSQIGSPSERTSLAILARSAWASRMCLKSLFREWNAAAQTEQPCVPPSSPPAATDAKHGVKRTKKAPAVVVSQGRGCPVFVRRLRAGALGVGAPPLSFSRRLPVPVAPRAIPALHADRWR